MSLELGPDERVLWEGQPAQGFRLAPQDLFAVPFAAFWLLVVLSVFSLVLAGEANADPITYLVLPFFLAIGVYMLVGRFLVDARSRRRTHYYLTNQRAVIESGLFRSNISSTSLAALPEVKFRGGRKGRGTIQFGSPAGLFGYMPPSWPGAAQFQPPTFEGVEDGERIFQLALSAQRDAQTRAS